jgi:hypothetical protein
LRYTHEYGFRKFVFVAAAFLGETDENSEKSQPGEPISWLRLEPVPFENLLQGKSPGTHWIGLKTPAVSASYPRNDDVQTTGRKTF